MWAVGSEGLDPTAGGGMRCTAYNVGGNINIYGFMTWFFKCFNWNRLRSHLGVCQRRVLIFVRFAEGFIGQRGFREGFYRCRGVFEGKNDLQQRGKGWSRFTKVARCHFGPFWKYMAIMPSGEDMYKIWGFIHLSVNIIRSRGKIGELYSRIRS